MKEETKQYIKASGADASVEEDFTELVRTVPELSSNVTQVAIQVKNHLYASGFEYDSNSFRMQDVLTNRKGNCLGLPLLVGAVLFEKGFNPGFQVVVNPHDAVYREEQSFLERLNHEMRYDSPGLANYQEVSPIYRFAPLEHLVIDADGHFIETTSREDEISGFESTRALTFSEALSFLYKDRAIVEGIDGNDEEVEKSLQKGLSLWENNRQIHAILAKIASWKGDETEFRKRVQRFCEINGDDSYFNFTRYLLTGEENNLDVALQKYPTYAEAIAQKARLLTDTDVREARFQYASASHLYANSGVLDLASFYSSHNRQLKNLFGKETVKRYLTEAFVA